MYIHVVVSIKNNVHVHSNQCTSLYIVTILENIRNIDIAYLPLGFQAGLFFSFCDSYLWFRLYVNCTFDSNEVLNLFSMKTDTGLIENVTWKIQFTGHCFNNIPVLVVVIYEK